MAGFFLPGENPMQPRSLLMRVPGPRVAWKESVGRDGWEGASGFQQNEFRTRRLDSPSMRTRASPTTTSPPAVPFCELCRTGLINANGTAASYLDCRISPHRLRCTLPDGSTPHRLHWDTTSARDSFCAVRPLPSTPLYTLRVSLCVQLFTCEVTTNLISLSFPTASPLHRPALQSKRLHVRRLLLRRLHRGSASPSSRPSAQSGRRAIPHPRDSQLDRVCRARRARGPRYILRVRGIPVSPRRLCRRVRRRHCRF